MLAGYLALALAFTYRLWEHPASSTTTGNPLDHEQISWMIGWTVHSVTHLHAPFLAPVLNLPDGVNMLWNTGMLLPSLLLSPLVVLLGPTDGPPAAHNLLLTLGPALSAFTAYLVARRLLATRTGAVAAGLLFGFGPAMTAHSIGHVDLTFNPLVPPLVWLGVRAVTGRRPDLRIGALLGLTMAAQLLTGEEMLVQAALAGVLVALVLALSRPRLALARLPAAAVTLGYALVIFLVIAGGPLAVQLFGPRSQHGSAFVPDYFKSDLAAFATPSRLLLLHSDAQASVVDSFHGSAPEQNAFLGWALLALVVVMVVRRWADLRVRVAATVVAALLLLSLGQTLVVQGQETKMTLPWHLVRKLPLLDAMLPNRLPLVAAGFVGLLLGLAVDAVLGARRLRGVVLPSGVLPSGVLRGGVVTALLVVTLVPLVPLPLAVTRTKPIPGFFTDTGPGTARASVPAGSAALVVPFPNQKDTEPMRWQASADYRFSMPGGYFTGPACHGQHCDGNALIGPLGRPTSDLLRGVEESGTARQPALADLLAAKTDLAFWGVDRVLLGPSLAEPALRQTLTALFGPPSGEAGGVVVWQHPRVPV